MRRDASIEDKTRRDIDRKKAVIDKKYADEKVALRRQMSLDDEERNRLVSSLDCMIYTASGL